MRILVLYLLTQGAKSVKIITMPITPIVIMTASFSSSDNLGVVVEPSVVV